MEFGPENVSLLERCPLFRGCYVQASVGLEPGIKCVAGVFISVHASMELHL